MCANFPRYLKAMEELSDYMGSSQHKKRSLPLTVNASKNYWIDRRLREFKSVVSHIKIFFSISIKEINLGFSRISSIGTQHFNTYFKLWFSPSLLELSHVLPDKSFILSVWLFFPLFSHSWNFSVLQKVTRSILKTVQHNQHNDKVLLRRKVNDCRNTRETALPQSTREAKDYYRIWKENEKKNLFNLEITYRSKKTELRTCLWSTENQ